MVGLNGLPWRPGLVRGSRGLVAAWWRPGQARRPPGQARRLVVGRLGRARRSWRPRRPAWWRPWPWSWPARAAMGVGAMAKAEARGWGRRAGLTAPLVGLPDHRAYARGGWPGPGQGQGGLPVWGPYGQGLPWPGHGPAMARAMATARVGQGPARACQGPARMGSMARAVRVRPWPGLWPAMARAGAGQGPARGPGRPARMAQAWTCQGGLGGQGQGPWRPRWSGPAGVRACQGQGHGGPGPARGQGPWPGQWPGVRGQGLPGPVARQEAMATGRPSAGQARAAMAVMAGQRQGQGGLGGLGSTGQGHGQWSGPGPWPGPGPGRGPW